MRHRFKGFSRYRQGTFSVDSSHNLSLTLTRSNASSISIPSVNLPAYDTTVSGQVVDNNLQITVNGVSSGDIPLPESGFNQYLIYKGNNSYLFQINVTNIDKETIQSINTKSSSISKNGANNLMSVNTMLYSTIIEGDVHTSDYAMLANKKYAINSELLANYRILEDGYNLNVTQIESIKFENVYIYKSNTLIDLTIEVVDALNFYISSNVDCYMYVNSTNFQIRPTEETKISFIREG